MEVRLNSDLQEKLARAAAEPGRNSEALVVEAVERMLGYEEWFAAEVQKGIIAADRGELVDHTDVRKLIDRKYPG